MIEPRKFDLSVTASVSHDPGVLDREANAAGTRWALVEYSPRSGRKDWCDTPEPTRLFLVDALPGA